MRNPLQDQLLKAGLVKKSKVAEVAREQAKQRHGKAPPPPTPEQRHADQLQAERAERDRALSSERNAQARAGEVRAQVRQIIQTHRIRREGEIDYRFSHEGRIRSVLVNEVLRAQLANGTLVIVRQDEGYELVPRQAAEKIRARDESAIVVDHGNTDTPPAQSDDDEHYGRFKVPDDLIW